MIEKKESISVPVLDPKGMEKFHFGEVSWPFTIGKDHNLFHINRIENYLDKLSFPLPPHRKTVFDFIFLTKGHSIRSKGLVNYNIKAGQFFFLPAYQITTHEFMSDDAEGFYLHFDLEIFKINSLEKFISKFQFLNFLSHPIVEVKQESIAPILNIFHRLESLDEIEINKPLDMVSVYLLALFKEVDQYTDTSYIPQKNAAANLVQRYKDSLSQFIYQKQKVNEYAEYLNVTPNHLNKCVRAITLKSAQDLLNEMLILEAKSLLKYSDLQVSEIAVKLGNQTPSNFSRFFKSKTGMMPKGYR